MNTKCRIIRFLQILCVSAFAVSGCSVENESPKLDTFVPAPELSFHLVRPESKSEAAMTLALDGKTPPGAIYLSFADQNGGLILEKNTRINADCIESASEGQSPASNRHIVNFKFNESCTKIFGEITAKSVGKQFAVVLDGNILTAPVINAPITGGEGFIELPSSMDAEKLARGLNGAVKTKKAK